MYTPPSPDAPHPTMPLTPEERAAHEMLRECRLSMGAQRIRSTRSVQQPPIGRQSLRTAFKEFAAREMQREHVGITCPPVHTLRQPTAPAAGTSCAHFDRLDQIRTAMNETRPHVDEMEHANHRSSPQAEAPVMQSANAFPATHISTRHVERMSALESAVRDLESRVANVETRLNDAGGPVATPLSPDLLDSLRAEVRKSVRTELNAVIPEAKRQVTSADTGVKAGGSSVDGQPPAAGGSAPQVDAQVYQVEGEDVELPQSIWSAALLIGTSNVDRTASIHLLLLLLLNLTAQVVFSVVVFEYFAQAYVDSDTIEGYRLWRRNVAHRYEHYDHVSGKSLAERVCDNDESLDTSFLQVAAVDEIFAYLGTGGRDSQFEPGPLMTFLSLLLFTLTVSKECVSTFDLCDAVCRIPLASVTSIASDDGGESWSIVALAPTRLACWLVTSGVKFSIAIFLLIFGLQYISYTIDLQDLLLNAVALEFVINTDELIFDSLAPLGTKHLVRRLRPMPIRRAAWCGIDRATLVATSGSIFTVLAAYFILVVPQTTQLEEARDVLCGGSQQFVYGTDVLGTTWWVHDPAADTSQLPERPWRALDDDEKYHLDVTSYMVEVLLTGDERAGGRPFDFAVRNCTSEECYAADVYERPLSETQRPGCCLASKTKQMGPEDVARTVAMTTVASVAVVNPGCADLG
eukprot:3453228-Prymnesium_polylepis.1